MTHYGNVLIDDLRSFLERRENTFVLRTAEAAEKFLEELTSDDAIDVLWLDHDLGLNELGEATDVMGFVRTLEERFWNDSAPMIRSIVIHTSNPVGAKNIEAALGRNARTIRVDARDFFSA